jgi:prepilin-type N-terminal cleavage/methylation domain-containing protein
MSRLRGFTLSEVLIMTAVLSILITISAPSYRQFIARGKALGRAIPGF